MDAVRVPPARPPASRFPSALVDRITLANGRSVILRPVFAQDAGAEQDFVRALSPASRRSRFHIGVRELTPSLLQAMTDVDHRCHVAVVAEVLDDDDEPTIVADARYVRSDCGNEGEFAITVADAWQALGLGRELLQRLLRHARRRGLTRLYGDILRTNVSMITLARRLGAGFAAVPGDASVIRAQFDHITEGELQ